MRIQKSSARRKRLLCAVAIIASLLLFTLSALLPVENLFMSFSEPESAFYYNTEGVIDAVVEGKDSACIIYHSANETNCMTAVVPKGENGWKIGTRLSYTTVWQSNVYPYYVAIYNARNTEDYYVTVWNPQAENMSVSDSRGSVFDHTVMGGDIAETQHAIYCAYVEDIDEQYFLNLDSIKLEPGLD